MREREQHDEAGQQENADDQTPEEFVEEIQNDPSHNPEDPGLEQVRGG